MLEDLKARELITVWDKKKRKINLEHEGLERNQKESREMNGRIKSGDKNKPHSITVWEEQRGRQSEDTHRHLEQSIITRSRWPKLWLCHHGTPHLKTPELWWHPCMSETQGRNRDQNPLKDLPSTPVGLFSCNRYLFKPTLEGVAASVSTHRCLGVAKSHRWPLPAFGDSWVSSVLIMTLRINLKVQVCKSFLSFPTTLFHSTIADESLWISQGENTVIYLLALLKMHPLPECL